MATRADIKKRLAQNLDNNAANIVEELAVDVVQNEGQTVTSSALHRLCFEKDTGVTQPTLREFENTSGEVFTATRLGAGNYRIFFTDTHLMETIHITTSDVRYADNGTDILFAISAIGTTSLSINLYDEATGNNVDPVDALRRFYLEIRFYN